MPQITLPAVFTNGVAMPSETWSKAIYDIEGQANNVAGALNGFLDLTNFDASETITQDEVGNRQITQTKQVAKTVNCDYFGDVFPANNLEVVAVRDSLAQGVSGAGISYYVPKEARAITFFWHVSVFPIRETEDFSGGDGPVFAGIAEGLVLTPWLNGVPQRRLERRLAETTWPGFRPTFNVAGAFMASRFWTGHWTYEPGMSTSGLWPSATTGLPGSADKKPTDVGWHKFGIRVSSVAKQARIRTCRMGYALIF